MLTMTDASDPRTIIDDNGKAYQVLGSGDETETLQRILDSDAAASALIIIADAVAGLGSALEAERSIESARAAWASSTDALLKVWRRARRRVKIINSACLSADESAQAALKPLGLAGAAAELRLCQPKPAMLSPLSLLCAAMMIQSDPALQRLARELEAATIGVGCSVDMWSTTSEAWLAARQQESVLGALRLEAQNAVVLERRLAEATSLTGAKLAALSEATAKLAAASTQNRALEQNLARASEASKKRETVHEQTTAKLTAAEHELELLRDTVGLQSGALDNALARLPQLEVLAKKVEALQGAATATTAVLAEAEANFKAAASRADVLQQKLTEANAKVVAHSELRAQLTDATERVSALEVSLAASRQQAAAYEKATAKLTAAEHELEILRKTAGLQSSALKDALARLPQLEVLAKKVEALQGAATATTAVLAEAEVNFKAAASRADALQQKLTDANAKVVAHSELRAQLAEATERVSALEESLAASRQQAAAYEKAAAKLTAAEHELEILRETAGLQSSALKDALARLPQLEVLTTKVEALQGAATATTAVLAEAEASFKAAASRADALQQKLTDANAKTAAHSELRAQLTAATERVSALEENLAASRQQAAAYENATARLTAAEQELQLLRRTVRLQTDALEEAAPRLPQLDKLTSQVKKLELETVTLGQKLATANGDLRVGHARRGSLESELEDLRHEARFARIASTGGLVGVLRSLPLGQNKRTTAAIRYPRPDTFVPSEVHIRDDWTDSLHVGQGGERIGSEIVSRRKSGHVFFGPYAALPAGSYAADVQINLRSGLFKSQGYSLEIVARDEVIASSNLELARGYNRFLMPFRISNDRGVSEIEVRLYSPGTNDIALKKLRLLESLSIASAPEQNTATSAPSTDAGAMPGVQSAAARAS